MFPASKIRVFVLFLFRSFYMPALFFLGIWGVQQFINGFISIVPSSAYTTSVAWWAHVGGFVFGLVVGYFNRRQFISRSRFDTYIASREDLT